MKRYSRATTAISSAIQVERIASAVTSATTCDPNLGYTSAAGKSRNVIELWRKEVALCIAQP